MTTNKNPWFMRLIAGINEIQSDNLRTEDSVAIQHIYCE